ncbi:alpha-mannosyltransferase NDAI_0A08550 [Naumovozyma dairenensis CBS 421]|uniref:Alpha-1,3-mannosyltransferase n=1 Tax=Naumovozyma dairenensis (strain ATCC 10597 / BCRC 20456 / CBS 421 / NBRC 0211 / NRRL Y-12639) TaxID=1071378 RepID=G0W5C0_NAUDC|nr:hypothetical protein NDAI_0A08550 [Naumovozyma dairenensis CBS 421]CCD23008.1 hypothetical protein NDAI_0A08550 [Naumovozyma dairenensis CBS 421]
MIKLSPNVKLYISRGKRAFNAKRRIIMVPTFILMVLFLIFNASSKSASENSSTGFSGRVPSRGGKDSTLSDDSIDSKLRISTFKMVEADREEVANESFLSSIFSKVGGSTLSSQQRHLLKNWDHASRLDQCKYLIGSLYNADPNWSNEKIVDFLDDPLIDDVNIALVTERLRLFDYCFLSDKSVDSKDVFDGFINVDWEDFQKRMFPFLKKSSGDVLLPKITNLKDGSIVEISKLMPSAKEGDFSASNNANFFASWKKAAHGKGIVVTMKDLDKNMFEGLVTVFEEMGNKLPIQLVSTGKDFTKETMDHLQNFAKNAKQDVYYVDCSPMLDQDFVEKNIKSYVNKWIGVLFNTFEELVFFDADSVPFIAPEKFLENSEYKKTGAYFFRDRSLGNDRTFQYCIDMIQVMEPSKEEKKLIKSKTKFETLNPPETKSSSEAAIFNSFFQNFQHNNVDSGVVMLNKKQKMGGLLMGFFLHLDAKMKKCVSGDKEMFWLGNLLAGQDYSIAKSYGSIAGNVGSMGDGKEGESTLYICSTQVAHVDKDDNILWVNGGLNTCKLPHLAQKDFDASPEYFKQRFGSVTNLQNIYNNRVKLDGLIKPDGQLNKWMKISECQNRMYCAFIGGPDAKKKGAVDDSKTLVRFNDNAQKTFKRIGQAWSNKKVPASS